MKLTEKLMRWDRTVVEVSSEFMRNYASRFHYVKATDGVWVPRCDLQQYEAGQRKPRR